MTDPTMGEAHDELAAMPAALRALVGIMLGDLARDSVLERVCEMTRSVLPTADDVSVTLVDRDAPRTAASTGPLATRGDETQYEFGEGPCLQALRSGAPVVADDVSSGAVTERWPRYAPRAAAAGISSSVSVPLEADGSLGALNVYSTRPAAFDAVAIEVAAEIARYAGVVINAAVQVQRAQSLADQLQQALESRAVIEQAKGILMAQHHCDSDEAFERLVRLSQEMHVKLREVAVALVDQTTKG
jgi:GAF domain-containing protein